MGEAEASAGVELVDEVAGRLLAADDGDPAAERELAERYATDPRLRPGDRVFCQSPSGAPATWVDVRTREITAVGGVPVPAGFSW